QQATGEAEAATKRAVKEDAAKKDEAPAAESVEDAKPADDAESKDA
ncbi:50S ribosomal protein L17, partial [Streptomyces sp. SID7982]|nr:50S ribosomal protein L17 [Streptomyces sp. SID7982]